MDKEEGSSIKFIVQWEGENAKTSLPSRDFSSGHLGFALAGKRHDHSEHGRPDEKCNGRVLDGSSPRSMLSKAMWLWSSQIGRESHWP